MKLLEWLSEYFQPGYGHKLCQYILAHNPQDLGDVERLTKQFERGCWW